MFANLALQKEPMSMNHTLSELRPTEYVSFKTKLKIAWFTQDNCLTELDASFSIHLFVFIVFNCFWSADIHLTLLIF